MKRPEAKKQRPFHGMLFFFNGMALCCLLLSSCQPAGQNSPANSSQTPLMMNMLKNQDLAQLQTFQQWISLMQHYGGNVTTYQQQYVADQRTLQNAKQMSTYTSLRATLTTHIETIKVPAMKMQGQSLQQKLQQELADWDQQHKYHNPTDNIDYPLGFEYGNKGIGGWIQDDLTSATNLAEYQQTIENENMYLANFEAMKANANDKTSYGQPHIADLQLMQHNGKMEQKVIIVSLSEQAMRVYDHGTLVKAFLVTTGRPDRPSIPGVWWVESKQTATIFTANVPKSDPGWYPDTPINYALQYHSNGYFIHDSWWRNDYGPGTNFPHEDSSGDSFSSQGSHGCINLSKENANWLYHFVEVYTNIIIY